jgi:ubiquinone/menaquinone biosynthesis C-methylase UbiE
MRPGIAVLDIGCGTGAITAGIAEAVGRQGYVLGVDRDARLLELARKEHGTVPHLRFEPGDATDLNFRSQFDIVTAARTLQWIAEPRLAVANMKKAAKPSGIVLVLDYNHMRNAWDPDPPAEFNVFYRAFLAWRQANHWDNEIADHLPELFRSAGLVDVQTHIQDEIVQRGEPDFPERSGLWSDVIQNIGGRITDAGFCTQSQLQEAQERYNSWVKMNMATQTLTMRTVTATVASR